MTNVTKCFKTVLATGFFFAGTAASQAQFGNIMLENWDAGPIGDLQTSGYTGAWDSVGFHPSWPEGSAGGLNGIAEIRTDSDNLFNRGTSNQILLLEEAAGFNFNFTMPSGIEVATLSYETYVLGFTSGYTDRLTKRFFVGGDTAINHGFQNTSDTEFRVRNEDPDRFDLDTFYHFDVIVNNSPDTITYAGGETLDPGLTAVWVNGNLSAVYDFGRTGGLGAGELDSFTMETFSNNPWSAFYDNIAITEGAFVIPEPSTYALFFGLGVLGLASFLRRHRK